MDSFKIKLVLPIVILSLCEVIFIDWTLSSVSEGQTQEIAIEHASQVVSSYKDMRQYYTKHVVSKVQEQTNLRIASKHKEQKDTIPLPATMIHELSKMASQNNEQFQVKLYSKYPFPLRKERKLDAFSENAVLHFETGDSERPYVQRETKDGHELIRIAIADKMSDASCVQCHNTHPQTPKDDWALGDVRGVLEVIMPIDEQINNSNKLIAYINLSIIFSFLLVSVLILLLIAYYKKSENAYLEQLKKEKDLALTSKKDKEAFFAGVSHELRTPLHAIHGFIKYIMRHSPDYEHKAYLEKIDQSANYLLKLVNGVLDITKFSTKNIEIKTHSFNLYKNTQVIYEYFLELAKQKDISLEFEYKSSKDLYLDGDWLRISEIFYNLLENAIKFTPENGSISLFVKYSENMLKIEVKDTGTGISFQEQEEIFQFSNKLKLVKDFSSLGFGLIICKSLVEAMNGIIFCSSTPEKGSVFYVNLPLHEGSPDEHTNLVIQERQLEGSVLVAEDNKTNQLLIKLLLTDLGIHVSTANDGLEAVKMYDPNKYDLILMDEDMPNMTGLVALREIRKKYPESIIIALTANAMEGDKERFLAQGMNDYLSKPVDNIELTNILSKYLKEVPFEESLSSVED